MKYYAVTGDPNELFHYGVKGMKWGEHIFGEEYKPKSLGYKRALSKLKLLTGGGSSSSKSVARKKPAAKTMSRLERRSLKQAQKIQRLNERRALSESKQAYNRLKFETKQERKFAKNERKMDKYAQMAREGRLNYGKLSDDQIARINNRLNAESRTAALGNVKNQKFSRRIKNALKEGVIKGVEEGTSAGMKEAAIAKVQNRFWNKRALDQKAKNQAYRDKEATRIKNKKTKKDIKQEMKNEMITDDLMSSKNIFSTGHKYKKYLEKKEKQERIAERKKLSDIIENRAKMAYEHGILPKDDKGNLSNNDKEIKKFADYYKQRYVDNKGKGYTLQQKEKQEQDRVNTQQKIERINGRANRLDEALNRASERVRGGMNKIENKVNNKLDEAQQRRADKKYEDRHAITRRNTSRTNPYVTRNDGPIYGNIDSNAIFDQKTRRPRRGGRHAKGR